MGVPDRVKRREYSGDIWGAFQPIIQLFQIRWTSGQLGSIELGCPNDVARPESLEKRIISVGVGWERVTTIMRGTVIMGARPWIGGQNLGAFGTNRSERLGLWRYIYTFGFLFTSGIRDLLGTI